MQKCIIKFASIMGITYSLFSIANAAVIPQGTKLAKIQVLNKDNSNEPATLDPSLSSENLGSNIILDLFEGLVITDDLGNIIPGVASSWSHSKDGLTYTFKLRKDAKWSDGSAVTANDFVYSFKRFVDPKTAATQAYLAGMLKNAEKITEGKAKPETLGVQALNAHTLQVTLEEATPYILGVLAGVNFMPLKKEVIEKHKASWTQPGNMISNGAYKLKSWKVSDRITLNKEKNYWDSKNTVIETVNYVIAQDKTASVRMYQAGQLDWTYGLPPNQYQKLKNDYPNEVKISPNIASSFIMFNTAKPPLNNPKLRAALSIAIDRNAFTKYISGRGEKPLYDIVPYGINNYSPYIPEWANISDKERIAKAQKLYKESGYSKDNPAVLHFSYVTNETDKKYVTSIASMWEKALGVKIELSSEEWKVHVSNTASKNYQITTRLWSADYNDAQNFLALLETSNAQNATNYSNKKFDELLKASNKELDPVKRKQMLLDSTKIAMEEYPVAPFYSSVSARLIKQYVKGNKFQNPQDLYYTKDLYIVEHDGKS